MAKSKKREIETLLMKKGKEKGRAEQRCVLIVTEILAKNGKNRDKTRTGKGKDRKRAKRDHEAFFFVNEISTNA